MRTTTLLTHVSMFIVILGFAQAAVAVLEDRHTEGLASLLDSLFTPQVGLHTAIKPLLSHSTTGAFSSPPKYSGLQPEGARGPAGTATHRHAALGFTDGGEGRGYILSMWTNQVRGEGIFCRCGPIG
eukprot:6117708-Pyramimonas_sp.AAC.1